MSEEEVIIPSWQKWPPNCCETCASWQIDTHDAFNGLCENQASTHAGTKTDSRFRCQDFYRKA